MKFRVGFGAITITDKSKRLVMEALESKSISSGEYVRELEVKFASLYGTKEAVAVSSGTDADALALATLYDFGAKRGDEVIIPALSFVATGNAVLHAGFTPVFVDIERDTLNINPKLIKKAITSHTCAIMPVHLMGKPAEMDTILDIANASGFYVIEDAAEAHGAMYKGKYVGAIGDLGAFSLYIAHVITTGEGGIILTNDPQKAEVLRSLRAHGRACKCVKCVVTANQKCTKRFNNPTNSDIRFVFERMGFSSKMNELEAAIGLSALDLFDEILVKRCHNLALMGKMLEPFSDFLYTTKAESYEKISPHAFPIILKPNTPFTRDALVNWLTANGIDSRNLFQSMPKMKWFGGVEGFPEAEYIEGNGLHIGCHQDITDEDVAFIGGVIGKFVGRKA